MGSEALAHHCTHMGITGCSGVKQLSSWYRNKRTFVVMEGKANWKIGSKFSAS